MRVPIFPADLLANQGFSRIAKKLQRSWPGDAALPLSAAQQTLSRGLGYRDFHDLQQTAKNGNPDAYVPTQDEVRDGISTSVFQTKHVPHIDEQDLDRLVKLLPLQELIVFRDAGLSRAVESISSLKATDDLPLATDEVVHDRADDTNGSDMDALQSYRPNNYIDGAGLKSIWEAVQRNGNLRDQCLFTLLLRGMRSNEIMAVKRSDIFEWNAEHCMQQLVFTKTDHQRMNMIMPGSFLTLVHTYVQHAGLSEDDLLFGSRRDPGIPTDSRERNRIIGSYLRDVLTDPALRSAHMIRKSIVTQMGHESRS